ncbi:MAG: class I SAM-dependent methyltransferase [Treponema sp.]|nr:class I SAM-dependent methyltransferase [Treponema sp.]
MAFTDNFGHPRGLLGRLMLVTMEREHLPMAKWAFGLLEVPAHGTIADIGCGGGYNVRRLLEKSASLSKDKAGAKVVGIDISEESVRKAKKVNRAEIGKRCEILQGSAENLPFSDGEIDLVTAFETVFFWKNVEACFSEIHRVLKSGRRVAVINNYGDPKIDWEKKVPCMTRRTAAEIKNLMENAGFCEIRTEEKGTLFFVEGRK